MTLHELLQKMVNEDGSANTAHTTNPVPVILVSKDKKEINQSYKCDSTWKQKPEQEI